ncbi:hypothetical protein BO94DRAFT_585790 [Aspergillus sclerotioniger CBS 115572]|uniref:Uncharacterized protein n=1 Tax=Aspergillus sclerotioniger CBS 115572 TaxID=1450535 RepID=A0A317WL58_9EURO|nr:hypothetical protein BO94DRAFT_585790 [Aspergillus sclerotioniger CBS 115572]PWY87236.1 hypothetical protein BO94DRAFT_585790 [Aspergillus sclerotioniger CBS 115572]
MPVSPRASKEEFMAALGLSTHDPQHEQYYRAMRDEAISTYNHLNESPTNLLESILHEQPSTKPPYFWHHIRPDRQRWAITEIARNAGPLTRPLFARGSKSPQTSLRQGDGNGSASGSGSGSGKKEYYDPVRNG